MEKCLEPFIHNFVNDLTTNLYRLRFFVFSQVLAYLEYVFAVEMKCWILRNLSLPMISTCKLQTQSTTYIAKYIAENWKEKKEYC